MIREEKPNYKREDKIRMLYDHELAISEYDTELTLNDFIKWCEKLKNKEKEVNYKLRFDCDIFEESEGFGYGKTYAHLTPWYKSPETDEEYNERIAKEEKEYNNYLDQTKLKESNYEQYQKDYNEFLRLKEKYHFETF